MATQAVKVKNEETQGMMVGGAVGRKVTGAFEGISGYLHDVRVEMKQVTWPTREDVKSTTGVVIGTVFFFGVFLWLVDMGVQHAVEYVFKLFGV